MIANKILDSQREIDSFYLKIALKAAIEEKNYVMADKIKERLP